ncbi:hypothetical protein BDR05DRAFT_98002 [Suillus weaverae]|nr:hypothetical protein BDR05DRAFT_98002 [Suillus weaverae]
MLRSPYLARTSPPLAAAMSQPLLVSDLRKFHQTVIFKPLVHIKIQELCIIVAQSSSPTDIDNSIPNPLPGLLGAFSLPNLRTLEIRGVPWPHEEFKSFLTRSNCPLETVILGAELKIRRRQRAECVALIPSLQIIVSQSEAS